MIYQMNKSNKINRKVFMIYQINKYNKINRKVFMIDHIHIKTILKKYNRKNNNQK